MRLDAGVEIERKQVNDAFGSEGVGPVLTA